MSNRFGTDILIQAPDPKEAALFYVNQLGFEISDNNPKMIGLHGQHINLFIEPGPPLGPVLEVMGASRQGAVGGARSPRASRASRASRSPPRPRISIGHRKSLAFNPVA